MRETAVTWQRRVARWKASGETAAVFGAREGVRPNTLRWWSWRLKKNVSPAAAPRPVRMVQLVRTPSSPRGSGVVVDLPDARALITVEPGFDHETFAVVVKLLGERP